jgi:hypothetical protein
VLETLALNVGRQVALHVTRAWLGHRKSAAEQNASLSDLLATGVTDRFARRKLERQLEDIGDQIAQRIAPLTREFPNLPENERQAALDAVVDALQEADLTDALMLGADMDGAKLARSVRERVAFKPGLNESAQVLYNRVLDETCVCLVSVVKNLPAFQPRALTEILSRLTHIETVLTQLPRTSLDSADEFTGRYMAFLSKTLDSLELFGVDLRRHKPQISVTVAYLSLSVSASTPLPTETRTDDLRVEHALADSPRTLLRGQAGSGKTTLLQWIAVNAARGTFTGPLAPWNGRVPFLVRLRSYPDGNLPQPQDMLSANAPPIAGQAQDGWAHQQFLTGNALLLVDGVDELRADRRARVRKWLMELLVAFPQIEVVVTSRPSAADPTWLTGFRSLLLEPMTPADVSAFCRRWHSAVREAGAPAELDEYEASLARHLEARRHLRTLASSPLLCALLCALNLDRHKQLPLDRMKLYEASLELLLERRDAERDLPVVQDMRLDTKVKITILQHLAWWLTLNGRAEASLVDAETQVESATRRMPDFNADASSTLRHLLERSGVIREPVQGRVDFVHRTFQEYLAGKQAADEHLIDFLVRNAHLDQWRETVVMGAGHATVPLRTNLLNSLLDRADREERHARRLRLVAASCLDTAHTMTPEVLPRVDAALDKLIPPKRKTEARSLSLGGDRVLRRLPTSLDGLSPAQAVACVRTAAFVGGPDALALMRNYAPEPNHDVQWELAKVWQYFPAKQYAVEVLGDAPLRNGTIEVRQIEHVRHLHHLQNLRRTFVDVVEDRAIDSLEFLNGVPNLHYLRAQAKNGAAVSLTPLTGHEEISGVRIYTVGGHTTDLAVLANLPSLRELTVVLPPGTSEIEFVHALRTLDTLDLLHCNDVADLSSLGQLDGLRELYLAECLELPALPELGALTTFRLDRTTRLSTPDLTQSLPKLTSLHLSNCVPLDDLTPYMAPSLTDITIRASPVSDLRPLARLTKLERLKLMYTKVESLEPLATVQSLREIATTHYVSELQFPMFADHPQPLTIKVRLPFGLPAGLEPPQLGPNVKVEWV